MRTLTAYGARRPAPGNTQSAYGARRQAGFSLVELLVSLAIMVVITGAIFSLVDPSRGTARAQTEVADQQQRMRVATDMITKDLIMAGAGTYTGIGVPKGASE